MKKVVLTLVTLGACLALTACGTSENKSTASSSTVESTEDSSSKEDKKMEAMEEDLSEKGVEVEFGSDHSYVWFTREKSMDYDYFNLKFVFTSNPNEIFEIRLTLKGNIDGKDKDPLYFSVSKGRIVEKSGSDTDINKLADILEELDYSDQEILEFVQWYHDNKE
ncbi:hypothetical protein [Candidatus Enterococcus clewellii]|uniref:Lipoprotein n=1 Tax=Candidatus Enterococcus clewellii TaxID=1834193 RepID=A0AAQ3VT01_9ENTE